ncbi:MAG: hypothetical protein Q8J74_06110 [Candidatus Didemnitutus sp.]|nr:hypothetical protein [Candidatus Didemnitutus sp.]
MNKHSHSKLIIRSGLALAFALVIGTTVRAQSTLSMKDKPAMEGMTASPEKLAAPVKAMMEVEKRAHCQEMLEQKQKMMAEMKEQDAALGEQVASMNSAPKDKKMDLLAAVVTRMVEQRIAMHAAKAKMDEEMKDHMMEHMQMGNGSMSPCPMMKGMDEEPADAHKTH